MDIELDVSVKRATGNLTFASTETEAVFILLGHLPGLARDKIEVSVNEAGTEISISGAGDKSSLETTIGKRLRLKNEFETKSFRKVCRLPDGVSLDQIDVGFCEEAAILMILMPKSVKGEVSGTAIQEVREEPEAPREKRIEGVEVISLDQPRDAEATEEKAEIDDAKAPKEEKEIEQDKEKDDAKSSKEEEENEQDQEKEEALIERKGTEEKSDQNEVESLGSDRDGDREPEHMVAEIKTPKEKQQGEEEETRTQPDRPQSPSIKMEAPDLDGGPPPPKAPEPINREEQENLTAKASEAHQPLEKEIEKASEAHQPLEKEDEAPEADRDLHQPKEQQTDPDHQKQPEDQVHDLEQQERREEVPELLEAPKSGGNDHQPEEKKKSGEASDRSEEAIDRAPEIDKPIEAPIEEDQQESSQDEEGEKERGNGTNGKKRRKERQRGGIPPPSLMVSAFLVSMVALIVQLVRTRRRR